MLGVFGRLRDGEIRRRDSSLTGWNVIEIGVESLWKYTGGCSKGCLAGLGAGGGGCGAAARGSWERSRGRAGGSVVGVTGRCRMAGALHTSGVMPLCDNS